MTAKQSTVTVTFPPEQAEALIRATQVVENDNASFGIAADWQHLWNAQQRLEAAIKEQQP